MAFGKDPAQLIYIVTALTLVVQMVLLDAYGGVVRAKSKTVLNHEDASSVAKGSDIVEADPPGVARVMRAHRNLLANGVPFLILGFLWVASGATATWALALFGTFLVARLVHTFAYVSATQPWRTVSFVIGQGALLGVAVQLVRNAVA